MDRKPNKKTNDDEEILSPYYIGYNMIIESMKNDNLFYGISKSLYLARCYTVADDILLHKVDQSGKYHCVSNTPYPKVEGKYITNYLNSNEVRINSYQEIQDDLGGLELIPITTKNNRYVISILNSKLSKQDKMIFSQILSESFSVILEKTETYKEIKKNSEEDGLTKLGNRGAYAKTVERLNKEPNKKVTIAVLDLFRLKYINDNLGHLAGDHYITETANILRRLFPKERTELDENGVEKTVHSNDYVFRIGGDEFVIISINRSPEVLRYLLDVAADEVREIEFSNQDVLTSLNVGIATRENEESLEELFEIADERLSDDKTRMYQELGIDRRK